MINGLRGLTIIVCSMVLSCVIANHRSTADEPPQVERLMRVLANPIAPYKVQAAAALAKMGKAAAPATDLLIISLTDSDDDVKLYAAYALANVTNQIAKSLQALVPLLSDQDEHVRYSAQWALAKLADDVSKSSDIIGIEAANIRTILKEAVTVLEELPHQKRHLTSLQIAVDHLASLDPITGMEPDLPEPAPDEDEQTRIAAEKFVSQFGAADRVQRLLMIEQVMASATEQPLLIRGIMTQALESNDYATMEYAVKRFGDAAQSVLNSMLEEIDPRSMPLWGSLLLSNVVVDSEPMVTKLAGMAADADSANEDASAAIQALGKARLFKADASRTLHAIIANHLYDDQLRYQAVVALAELGEVSNSGLNQLWVVLDQSGLPELVRDEIVANLYRLAPTSPEAIQKLTRNLKAMQVNEYQFSQIAAAIGSYGPLGRDAIAELVRGLVSSEPHIRHACVEALAKMGEQATPAVDGLVALIANPETLVSTKTVAAAALKLMGRPAIMAIERRLATADSETAESLLRSIAIIGPEAKSALMACQMRLNNENESKAVRVAAATAVGSMGPLSVNAADDLHRIVTNESHVELRCAALVALAQVHPILALTKIIECQDDNEFEVQLTAAFARHLIGQTADSFKNLLALIEDDIPYAESSRNQIIEDTLLDLGPVIVPMLQNTMRDAQANLSQRIACTRVFAQIKPTEWTSLVDLLADEMIGQEVYQAIITGWDFEEELLPILLSGIEDRTTGTVAKARMMQLADYITDGLGAGGEEDQWPGFAVMRHLGQPLESAIDAKAAQTANEGEPTPSGGETAEALTIPEPLAAAATESPNKREVTVFYGTNREPNEVAKSNFAAGYTAALGLAMAALATCTLGFLRKKSPHYTLAAVTGLGAVTAVAVRTIHLTDFSSKAAVNVEYSGRFSDTVEIGYCEVTIPENHVPGELESPNLLLKLEVTPDPQKHIVVQSVRRLEPSAFYNRLDQELDRKGDSLLVFVHGYNVSFNDAARRTAQMAFDLEYPGAPVFYSWPSHANWYQYRLDRENIQKSVGQMKQFLTEIAQKSKAKTINLVAHSMGNVGLTEALAEMGEQTRFNEIVLAAPDIDAKIFKEQIAPKIVKRAQRVTLYTSRTDLALIASKYFNHGPRAGDSGPEPVVYPGMDTIDATAVDSSLLGHSYYGSNVDVLFDLGQLLGGKPIQQRGYLKPVAQRMYWAFEAPQTAQEDGRVMR